MTAVGVGPKRIKGECTDRLAICVWVERKRDVTDDERIPAEIEEVPTDVLQGRFRLPCCGQDPATVSPPPPGTDGGTYDPLVGGISVGPCDGVAFTQETTNHGPAVAVVGRSGAEDQLVVAWTGTDSGTEPHLNVRYGTWAEGINTRKVTLGDTTKDGPYLTWSADSSVLGVGFQGTNDPIPGLLSRHPRLRGPQRPRIRRDALDHGRPRRPARHVDFRVSRSSLSSTRHTGSM